MALRDQTLFGVIDALAVGRAGWTDLALALRNAFGGRYAWARVHNGDGTPSQQIHAAGDWQDEGRAQRYRHGHWSADFLLAALLTAPPGEPMRWSSLHARPDIAEGEYYRDYIQPRDIDHVIECLAVVPSGPLIRFGTGRTKAQPPFSKRDEERLRRVAQRLQGAIRIRYLNTGGDFGLSDGIGFDLLPEGVVMLDETGKAFAVNLAARLALSRVRSLAIIDGRLHCLGASDAGLSRLIDDALLQRPAGIVGEMDVCAGDGPQLRILVARMPVATGSDREVPVIILGGYREPAATSEDISTLAGRWRLTPKEVEIVVRLVEGSSLGAAAAAIGIAYETSRFHLKNIYRKVGVNNQAALTRLFITDYYCSSEWLGPRRTDERPRRSGEPALALPS
ncbi:MAG: helix-turn-helix transcriptional regulator [Bauldia sp.]|nr:helix-turn-helix transcriptional regulator [Bauldia sp.]MCW5718420.1 helix-turn-helix transcriptional regulator [Bauldia sp.]